MKPASLRRGEGVTEGLPRAAEQAQCSCQLKEGEFQRPSPSQLHSLSAYYVQGSRQELSVPNLSEHSLKP